jgi:hypothetical protein
VHFLQLQIMRMACAWSSRPGMTTGQLIDSEREPIPRGLVYRVASAHLRREIVAWTAGSPETGQWLAQ